MARNQNPELNFNTGLTPQAAPVNLGFEARMPGITPAAVDYLALSQTLASYYSDQQAEANKKGAAEAVKFAAGYKNPDASTLPFSETSTKTSAEQQQEQLKTNYATELDKQWAKLIAEGQVPEGAKPMFYQKAKELDATRIANNEYQSAIQKQLAQASSVTDENGNHYTPSDPKFMDQVFANALKEVQGYDSVRDYFGSRAFAAAKLQIDQNALDTVAKQKTANYVNKAKQDWSLEVQNKITEMWGNSTTGSLDDAERESLSQIINDGKYGYGFADTREVFANAVETLVRNVAYNKRDPQTAERMLSELMQVKVGGLELERDEKYGPSFAQLHEQINNDIPRIENEARQHRKYTEEKEEDAAWRFVLTAVNDANQTIRAGKPLIVNGEEVSYDGFLASLYPGIDSRAPTMAAEVKQKLRDSSSTWRDQAYVGDKTVFTNLMKAAKDGSLTRDTYKVQQNRLDPTQQIAVESQLLQNESNELVDSELAPDLKELEGYVMVGGSRNPALSRLLDTELMKARDEYRLFNAPKQDKAGNDLPPPSPSEKKAKREELYRTAYSNMMSEEQKQRTKSDTAEAIFSWLEDHPTDANVKVMDEWLSRAFSPEGSVPTTFVDPRTGKPAQSFDGIYSLSDRALQDSFKKRARAANLTRGDLYNGPIVSKGVQTIHDWFLSPGAYAKGDPEALDAAQANFDRVVTNGSDSYRAQVRKSIDKAITDFGVDATANNLQEIVDDVIKSLRERENITKVKKTAAPEYTPQMVTLVQSFKDMADKKQGDWFSNQVREGTYFISTDLGDLYDDVIDTTQPFSEPVAAAVDRANIELKAILDTPKKAKSEFEKATEDAKIESEIKDTLFVRGVTRAELASGTANLNLSDSTRWSNQLTEYQNESAAAPTEPGPRWVRNYETLTRGLNSKQTELPLEGRVNLFIVPLDFESPAEAKWWFDTHSEEAWNLIAKAGHTVPAGDYEKNALYTNIKDAQVQMSRLRHGNKE